MRLRPVEQSERGALARLGPAAVRAAIAGITSGQVYDLDPGRFPGMHQWTGHPPFTLTSYRTPRGERARQDLPMLAGAANSAGLGFSTELIVASMHTGAHIDALCHVSRDGDGWYGGYDPDEHLDDFGARRCDAATLDPVIVRGILLDLPALRGVEHLPGAAGIDKDEIEEVIARQGTPVEPDSAVLIRTGAMTAWPDPGRYGELAGAGLTLSGARYLADQGAVLVGADNPAVEQAPSTTPGQPQPVHDLLIRQRGIPHLEYLWLEDLAADRAYRFALLCLPLKIVGATASWVRPVAIT
jgi:kynurenine formamidase